jgi:CRISPR/Cas system-associated protein Csx1
MFWIRKPWRRQASSIEGLEDKNEESFMSLCDALKRRKTVSVFSFQLPVKDELKTEN